VIAAAAMKGVAVIAATKGVMAIAALQGVVAAAPLQQIGPGAAGQMIAEPGADHLFDPREPLAEALAMGAPGGGAGSQIEPHPAFDLRPVIAQRIAPRAPRQRVIAAIAVEDLAAIAAPDHIGEAGAVK